MDKNTNYHHFVLYGSQLTEQAQKAYLAILQNLSAKNKTINFHLASANNFEKLLIDLKDTTLFCPLFLMEGIEYKKIESKINKIFPFKKGILQPISHYESFLNKIFVGNTNKVFLMHGSAQYENYQKHTNIISYGKKLGYHHYCFLEGAYSYQEIITDLLKKKEKIDISPLLFFTNNHIKNDVVNNFLSKFEYDNWSIELGLLERPDTQNAIIEIMEAEICSITT